MAKKRQYGINQSRATIYLLCYALTLFVGITLIMLATSIYNPEMTSQVNESAQLMSNETKYALLIAIGTGVMATGLCGFITFGWVIYSDNEEEKRKQINNAAKRIGLVDAFEKRSIAITDEYRSRVAKARHNIDIMGFGLSALLNDLGDYFAMWAQHSQVRIILICPNFPDENYSLAKLRDKEEKTLKEKLREKFMSF